MKFVLVLLALALAGLAKEELPLGMCAFEANPLVELSGIVPQAIQLYGHVVRIGSYARYDLYSDEQRNGEVQASILIREDLETTFFFMKNLGCMEKSKIPYVGSGFQCSGEGEKRDGETICTWDLGEDVYSYKMTFNNENKLIGEEFVVYQESQIKRDGEQDVPISITITYDPNEINGEYEHETKDDLFTLNNEDCPQAAVYHPVKNSLVCDSYWVEIPESFCSVKATGTATIINNGSPYIQGTVEMTRVDSFARYDVFVSGGSLAVSIVARPDQQEEGVTVYSLPVMGPGQCVEVDSVLHLYEYDYYDTDEGNDIFSDSSTGFQMEFKDGVIKKEKLTVNYLGTEIQLLINYETFESFTYTSDMDTFVLTGINCNGAEDHPGESYTSQSVCPKHIHPVIPCNSVIDVDSFDGEENSHTLVKLMMDGNEIAYISFVEDDEQIIMRCDERKRAMCSVYTKEIKDGNPVCSHENYQFNYILGTLFPSIAYFGEGEEIDCGDEKCKKYCRYDDESSCVTVDNKGYYVSFTDHDEWNKFAYKEDESVSLSDFGVEMCNFLVDPPTVDTCSEDPSFSSSSDKSSSDKSSSDKSSSDKSSSDKSSSEKSSVSSSPSGGLSGGVDEAYSCSLSLIWLLVLAFVVLLF